MSPNSKLARALSALREDPGVLGSMACDGHGRVVEASFPPQFERARASEAARLVADASGALQIATGRVAMLDFRYRDTRIVVKPFDGGYLLLLCSASVAFERLASSIQAGAVELASLVRAAAAGAPQPLAHDLGAHGLH